MNKKVTVYRICSVQLPKMWVNTIGEVETTGPRFLGKYLSSILSLPATYAYDLINRCFSRGRLFSNSGIGLCHEEEVVVSTLGLYLKYRYYPSANFIFISAFYPKRKKKRTRYFFADEAGILYEAQPMFGIGLSDTISRLMTIAKQLRGKK